LGSYDLAIVYRDILKVVHVDAELEIKAYYAGHVLGAAMFQVRVGSQSVVYTGDYNMTPDRHLGSAWIDKCRPDLLITESTYATTVRDSKRCRERDFLKKVHDCVDKNGKVLIPVFALGRAQELCILLETYWDRMNLKVPIYFSAGLTEKANNYYKMFISWTNEKIRKTFVDRNMFDFKHIKPFDRSSYIDNPGPMVVFATPGMLHAGLSLTIFKKWCTDERNMIIMPGYCVSGTVGHKILNGQKRIEFEKGQVTEVKMSVQYMSFSAHADAKGIMQLITWCEPDNVMLVHGEGEKMKFLKTKIKQEHGIDCFMPANGETAVIPVKTQIPAQVSVALLKREADLYSKQPPDTKRPRMLHGVLVMKSDGSLCLEDSDTAVSQLGLANHTVRFTSTVTLSDSGEVSATLGRLQRAAAARMGGANLQLQRTAECQEGELRVASVIVQVEQSAEDDNTKDVRVSWAYTDDHLGSAILQAIQAM